MTKKQWVAPSAQLVQFAANEYVAACGTGTIYQFFAHIFDVFLMVESGYNTGRGTYSESDNILGVSSYNAASTYPLNDADSTKWNDFYAEATKEVLGSKPFFDSLLSSEKGGWSDQKDIIKDPVVESTTALNTVQGWYCTSDSLDSTYNKWESTQIWYDSANDQIYAGHTDTRTGKTSS